MIIYLFFKVKQPFFQSFKPILPSAAPSSLITFLIVIMIHFRASNPYPFSFLVLDLHHPNPYSLFSTPRRWLFPFESSRRLILGQAISCPFGTLASVSHSFVTFISGLGPFPLVFSRRHIQGYGHQPSVWAATYAVRSREREQVQSNTSSWPR